MFDFFANHSVMEGDYRLEDIKVEEELGRGNAHVYTATVKEQTYALKQIEIKNDYEYQNFLKEISNMQEISSKSEWIVKYEGYLVTKMERNQYDKKKYAYILMECAEENLEQFLSHRLDYKYRLKVHDIVRLVEQILASLASLEEINRAHCDVKPENILIMNSKTLSIKLCDVGSSKVVSKESLEEATILGTVPFLAPELIKIKGTKILGNRAFKSDVFSFGLVVLYLITHKKFKSHERLDVEENTYREVIGEWIKEARELTDGEHSLCEILRNTLEFDEFKRQTFKELKFLCFNELKKKSILSKSFISKLEKEEDLRSVSKMQDTSYFSSPPSNQLSLFKTRRVEKINFTKTSSNAFKISKPRNSSPSPVKRTISLASSNSPDKTEKELSSMQEIYSEMKKVVYINEGSKNYLPETFEREEEKNFVLGVPDVRFKRAETVTVLSTCTYDVFEALELVNCKRIYIETMDKEVLGVAPDASILRFSKIRINLTRCDMIGGFEGLFRIITNENLELLELHLAETEVSTKEIVFLLDRLICECPYLQTLLLSFDRKLITEEQHAMIADKVARLHIKKLTLLMNECYIQYEQPTRWPLPRSCEILYLDYGNNLLKNVVNNLSLSLANAEALKEIILSFENNALTKGEVHMLIKSITKLGTLERVTLNFAFNKIEDLKYLENALTMLKSITYLELKLHSTDVDLGKILELIENLKEELFVLNFSLRMLKISCDRYLPLLVLKGRVEQICNECSSGKNKMLRSDVMGFDNKYYTVYIKKNDKSYSNRLKPGSMALRKESGGMAVKKVGRLELLPKMATMSEGLTMSNFTSNFNSNSRVANLCYQLYTSNESYNNFICLTCCEQKQMNKHMFYCKFCATNCTHALLKDHYFVKVSESTRCVCAYSGCCKSDTKVIICGDRLAASLKKEYQCLKCELSFCMVCVDNCREHHKEWVREVKELSYFKCRSKVPTH